MAVVPEDADLPLAEERVTIRKRRHRRKVRVQTVTDKLTETLRATLQTAEVQIERVAIDREVTTPPSIRTEGDVTIVPILEEILVVKSASSSGRRFVSAASPGPRISRHPSRDVGSVP